MTDSAGKPPGSGKTAPGSAANKSELAKAAQFLTGHPLLSGRSQASAPAAGASASPGTAPGRAQAQAAPSPSLPTWKDHALRGALTALKFIAAPVGLWVLMVKIGILPSNLTDAGSLLISVVLYLLSLPTGILLRLDQVLSFTALNLSADLGLLVAAAYAVVNFILVAVVRGFFKSTGGNSKGAKTGGQADPLAKTTTIQRGPAPRTGSASNNSGPNPPAGKSGSVSSRPTNKKTPQ